MKKKLKIQVYPFVVLMGLALILTNSCKDKGDAPLVSTSAVSEITITTAMSGGLILSGDVESIIERGVCWSTNPDPTIKDSKAIASSPAVNYTSNITGLAGGTTYYVRAYATNSEGTGYGDARIFVTLPLNVPALTTSEVTEITDVTAISGGTITSDGGSSVIAKGVCWSTEETPTIENGKTTDGTGTEGFISNIDGLASGTKYYIRAYATNSTGTGYGNVVSFVTQPPIGYPVITTSTVSYITQTTAVGGGVISSEGVSSVIARGLCWGTTETPTIDDSKTVDGSGGGSFTGNLTNLTVGTTYFVRAYATNGKGTSYGEAVSFKTLEEGEVTIYDVDGNLYHTIVIGDQRWLVENLSVTHYRNGDPIPFVSDSVGWSNNTTEGAYCNVADKESNVAVYGRMYNYYAVSDSRNIAPEGCHVASAKEWKALTTFLGGDAAIPKLKATSIWLPPYDGGTNESGFSAYPAGYRDESGEFVVYEKFALWWTSTKNTYQLLFDFINQDSQPIQGAAMSVRCIVEKVN